MRGLRKWCSYTSARTHIRKTNQNRYTRCKASNPTERWEVGTKLWVLMRWKMKTNLCLFAMPGLHLHSHTQTYIHTYMQAHKTFSEDPPKLNDYNLHLYIYVYCSWMWGAVFKKPWVYQCLYSIHLDMLDIFVDSPSILEKN